MTKTTGIPKRWRPRFSLRTLVLLVTLVCVYFGAWDATKRWGVPSVEELATKDMVVVGRGDGWAGKPYGIKCPLPFVVGLTQHWRYDAPHWGRGLQARRRFIWLFGVVAEIRDDRNYSDE